MTDPVISQPRPEPAPRAGTPRPDMPGAPADPPRAPPLPATEADQRALPVGQALRRLIEATLAHLRADLPQALAGEAEAVHRMRSALRRQRAILRALRPVLPASAAAQDRALQRLGRVLGGARDWDVFLDETLPLAAADGVAPIALAALRRAATARRRTAYGRLRRALPAAMTETLRGLEAWADTVAVASDRPGALLAAPLDQAAPALLRRAARRLRGGARVIARGDRARLHRLRKQTRRLRDALDALAPPSRDRAARRALGACRGFADRLGRMNDAATAAALAARLSGPGGAGPAPASLLSDWAARKERAALRRLPKAWRRLRERRDRMTRENRPR